MALKESKSKNSMCRNFLQSVHRQDFPFPDTVMYYITQKPSIPKTYEKLIQTCKYFFAKNPILIFNNLRYIENQWETFKTGFSQDCKRINFKNTIVKLWIISYLSVWNLNASSIIPKLYDFRVECLTLGNQIIFFDELKLFSTVPHMGLIRTTVKSKDGRIISFEEIFQYFSNIYSFFYDGNPTTFTENTVEKLLENKKFCRNFELKNIPECFDIEKFYKFILKNKKIDICLYFAVTISEDYKNRLEEIVDEILQNETPDFKIPYIHFHGMDIEKEEKLQKLATPTRCF